jgi:hypothetical protein
MKGAHMRWIKLAVTLLASPLLMGAGSIFDDQDPSQTPPPPAKSGPSSVGQPATGQPAAGVAPDAVAQRKHEAALAKAQQDYQQAVAAIDKQLIVDLNAAMDTAMANRNVEDVKRIDAELTQARDDLRASAVAAPAAGTGSDPDTATATGKADFRSVVLVCDCAGAMINCITTLKADVNAALETLRPNQTFNVLFFQDEKVLKLGNMLLPATPENKRKASDFVGSAVTAGTFDPVPALTFALKSKPQIIYYLATADDTPPDVAALANLFRRMNADHRIKVNVILFTESRETERASEEDAAILQSIASDNGGTLKWIRLDQP